MENTKKVVVSGITATGKLTIGNYIGAIKSFIELQENNELYIFVANMHAIVNPIDSAELKRNTLDIAALYLACGLDNNKASIFIQSDVHEHAELGHMMLCLSTMGELNRMTQFKDKSQKSITKNGTESIPTGLFTYPTLMAGDILLYQPDLVPVGRDQKQHIELTQELAKRFNNRFGKTFKEFNHFIPKNGAKIMSLVDPSKKMSKSDENQMSSIYLLDDLQKAHKKIMSAITDNENKVLYDIENKPGVSNLITIYANLTNKSINEIIELYSNKGYKEFKTDLADIVVKFLEKLQNKFNEFRKEETINKILNDGAIHASERASKTLQLAKERMGLNRHG
ncbi:tryptophan--tRNA ligase [Mycoplasma sp. (ex Biomphalaria glabrata)]|uniref:tryptophan--tRNA ligase n=1 Tax=Biomphalaria glabrata TaxID=6526 RepID=A0A2C9LUU6_BIOGL|nr:tryptophan--tRNA ligase [Mycoplasma sp. (ex Biomphalaria glabrata)]ALV23210.1 tryptophan--tRNA ligase [Mycoplasma sp. (ex Biomphalaria glabrata)]